ncbi:MAG: exosortase/archaeosortase family protein [Acidobacteria bacterium]|nr:exosortase/archaeosortase family protein [Acidobacteriota bacterium]
MASDADNILVEKQPEAPSGSMPWAAFAWFAVLLLVCYAPVLLRLVRQWADDPDMGHGFFVPVLAGYIAWLKRGELLNQAPSPNWWGLLVVAYGALQLFLATLGAELFLARTAFVISLAGVVLVMGGARSLRILAFPLFLLFFMVPIPAIIYSQITFPLQLFASQVSASALSFLGIPVLREGNILELASQRLNVVEACSGIRSLLSLSFLSLIYAYFFDKKVWMRPVLLVATVPIAVVANASRVTLTGLVSEYNPQLAEGIFHYASGWVIFMVALVILVAFHQFVNWICRRLGVRG